MKAKGFLISILIFWSYSLVAQIVSVHSELSSDTISIGEQLTYEFRVETSNKTKSEFPRFYDTISSGIEIIDLIGIDTTYVDEKKTVTGKYLVTSFEKGENIVAPKAVEFSYGGQIDTAYSLPLTLVVVAPVVDTTMAIKPIKPPVNTPVNFKEALPWIGIGLGGLTIIALIVYLVWYFRKRKSHPELFASKPKEPAHIIALRNLDQLREDKLMESSHVKKYYSRLTEIIRIYLSDLYGLQAMESTSSEIMEEFKLVNREENQLNDMLEALLQLADLVKFAKEDPLRKEREQHLNDAYKFVNETYVLFEPSSSEDEKDESSEDRPESDKSAVNKNEDKPSFTKVSEDKQDNNEVEQ